MIEHQVEQGSPAWLKLRLGIPTASEMDKIITPKTGELSASAKPYAYRLLAEKLLGEPLQSLEGLEWVERGKEMEPAAVRAYEFLQETETRPVGFITTDDGLVGASPDRLWVGKAWGVEIKCPAPQTHIGYLVDGWDVKYRPQVMAQMFVGELEGVDRYSYHPRMPPALEVTSRDEKFIGRLRIALEDFQGMFAELEAKARASGYFEEQKHLRTVAEAAYADRMEDAGGCPPAGARPERRPKQFDNGYDPPIANSAMPFV
ncbi:lambda exonuclease family protein [Muricoccus aerilatus]|uniref:lambda exonuclease family protein n=1 Tax=Muricoccus aerilatus TaxID=452982 RepID=UPI0006934864|nr:lambda exonuclease family protein [Roseomonas aerilata]